MVSVTEPRSPQDRQSERTQPLQANYLWNTRAMVTFPYPGLYFSVLWLTVSVVGAGCDLITYKPPAFALGRARLALSCTCRPF